jgi:hypothetical protein
MISIAWFIALSVIIKESALKDSNPSISKKNFKNLYPIYRIDLTD